MCEQKALKVNTFRPGNSPQSVHMKFVDFITYINRSIYCDAKYYHTLYLSSAVKEPSISCRRNGKGPLAKL